MEEQKIIHLHNRFGFGITEKELENYSMDDLQHQLDPSHMEYETATFGDLESLSLRSIKGADKGKLIQSAQAHMVDLTGSWMNRMISSSYPFLEKINLFWHHHFACEIKNPVFAREYSNMIRKNSLGNFRELLRGVSQSAAMIAYLNLRQNKKGSPNEDFARELCELFTLGIDTEYTERDIQEIARAFTGWSHDVQGNFKFRRRLHDRGRKSIFNQEGKFDGDDVIDLILENKRCARFIAGNVYEYFINPQPNKDHIDELTNVLYESDYDLQKLFLHITEVPWFYDDENIMVRIKSPIEFIVAMGRPFRLHHDDPLAWRFLMRALDQILYRPPNVAGWKVNRQWINSNSLTLRLRLPSIILDDGLINMELSPALDEMITARTKKRKGMNLIRSFEADWDHYFKQNPDRKTSHILVNNRLSSQALNSLNKMGSISDKKHVLQFMSLPEYQLA